MHAKVWTLLSDQHRLFRRRFDHVAAAQKVCSAAFMPRGPFIGAGVHSRVAAIDRNATQAVSLQPCHRALTVLVRPSCDDHVLFSLKLRSEVCRQQLVALRKTGSQVLRVAVRVDVVTQHPVEIHRDQPVLVVWPHHTRAGCSPLGPVLLVKRHLVVALPGEHHLHAVEVLRPPRLNARKVVRNHSEHIELGVRQRKEVQAVRQGVTQASHVLAHKYLAGRGERPHPSGLLRPTVVSHEVQRQACRERYALSREQPPAQDAHD